MKFFEASSKENVHIYPIFQSIASELYNKNRLKTKANKQINNVRILLRQKFLKLLQYF